MPTAGDLGKGAPEEEAGEELIKVSGVLTRDCDEEDEDDMGNGESAEATGGRRFNISEGWLFLFSEPEDGEAAAPADRGLSTWCALEALRLVLPLPLPLLLPLLFPLGASPSVARTATGIGRGTSSARGLGELDVISVSFSIETSAVSSPLSAETAVEPETVRGAATSPLGICPFGGYPRY